MFKKSTLIVLLLNLLYANVKADLKPYTTVTQNSLLNFMIKSRQITQANPQRSLDCFAYYLPILNGITADYETAYGACLDIADQAKSQIDDAMLGQRQCMTANAENACNLLKACGEHTNSIDFFQCYVQVGNQNSKTMYAISNNASDILLELQKQYYLVEFEQTRCTNAADRSYTEDTTKTYEEMQRCIQGSTPVPETNTNMNKKFKKPKPAASSKISKITPKLND